LNVIIRCIKQIDLKRKSNVEANPTLLLQDEIEVKNLMLCLPYKGIKGETIVKKVNTEISKCVKENTNVKVIYKSTKLSSFFNIKDKTSVHHSNDLVYRFRCPDENCDVSYIGETGRRFNERILDHAGKDTKSHVLKHAKEKDHELASHEHFEMLGSNFHGNKYKRRISEALFIKEFKPSLNVQEKSFPLKLFN